MVDFAKFRHHSLFFTSKAPRPQFFTPTRPRVLGRDNRVPIGRSWESPIDISDSNATDRCLHPFKLVWASVFQRMAATSDMFLQALQRYLDSTVAAQGDADCDGASQHPPYIYPSVDLGCPPGPPPPLAPRIPSFSSNYIGFPSAEHHLRAYQAVRAEVAPLRPSVEGAFDHTLPVHTPQQTVSLLRMAARSTFDPPVARQRAAANNDERTYIIGSYTAEASTMLDLALLPSLSRADPNCSTPVEVDMTLSTTEPSTGAVFSPLEEKIEWETDARSEVLMTPGLRKRHAKLVTQAANVRHELSTVETCLCYAQRQAYPPIHGGGSPYALESSASVSKARAACTETVEVCVDYNLDESLLTQSHYRSQYRLSRVLRRIWHRVCCCIRPETD
ncbi:unnamed protein product [Dibothriocephalus latus]|uniref:Uncharacterized protein n=1 Tax=Dibothriocephalus latus TaxID=60516 RepID=A0A3P6SVS5_DIBLA|nr:unnamed protein product [Dibothriocephalus latus]